MVDSIFGRLFIFITKVSEWLTLSTRSCGKQNAEACNLSAAISYVIWPGIVSIIHYIFHKKTTTMHSKIDTEPKVKRALLSELMCITSPCTTNITQDTWLLLLGTHALVLFLLFTFWECFFFFADPFLWLEISE